MLIKLTYQTQTDLRNNRISSVTILNVWIFENILCCFLGLEEEGLYRISGATSDIQRLKKTFEKSQLFSLVIGIVRTAT